MLEMRKLYKLSLFLGYSDHSSNKGCVGEFSSKCHKPRKEIFGDVENKYSIRACAQLSLRESGTPLPSATTLGCTQFSVRSVLAMSFPCSSTVTRDSTCSYHGRPLSFSLPMKKKYKGANIGTLVNHIELWDGEHGM